MSCPGTLAFRMSSAAAASPPNPPPTICAFIDPSSNLDIGLLELQDRGRWRPAALSFYRPAIGDERSRNCHGGHAVHQPATRGASRWVKQRERAHESDDGPAKRNFHDAGRAQSGKRSRAVLELRSEDKAIENRKRDHDCDDHEFHD